MKFAKLVKYARLNPAVGAPPVVVLPTNTVLPVITGVRTVGGTLTSTLGDWENLGGASLITAWLRDGSPIMGAAGSEYTQQEADAGYTVTSRVSALHADGVVSALAVGVLVRPAPTISGTNATDATDASYTFTPTLSGGRSPYTVTSVGLSLPPGLSLNATTGVITGTPTTAGFYDGMILQVADADGLTGTLALLPIVVTIVPVGPPVGVTVVTHNGESVYFSTPVLSGVSPSGLPWIDTSQGDVVITHFSTPSESVPTSDYLSSVNRALVSGASYQAHGAEWCPFFIPYTGEGGQPLPLPAGARTKQGFSERFAHAGSPVGSPASFNVSGNAALIEYDETINICPGNTGVSFVIPQGTTGTAVKMVDHLDGTSGMRNIDNNYWRRSEKFAVFTFVNGVPPDDALMPSASLAENDPERDNFFLMSEADKGSLGPGQALPASWDVYPLDPNDLLWQPFFGQFGEFLRPWVINPNVSGGDSSGYSRDYAGTQARHMMRLLAAGPAANETEWAKVLQVGIQLFGLAMRGHIGIAGAGQAAGYKLQMQFVLHAFHSVRPELLDLFQNFRANYTHQQFYGNSSLIGINVNFNGNHNANMGTFMPAHMGLSFFAHTMGRVRDTPLLPRADGTLDSVRDTDYEVGSAGTANFVEAVTAGFLYNGPGNRRGHQVIADMDSWEDTLTERSASIDYIHNYRTWAGANSAGGPLGYKALDILGDSANTVMTVMWRDLYDAFRDSWGLEYRGAPPDAACPNYNKTNIDSGSGDGRRLLAATAGGFQWDLRNVGYHRLDVVDARVEYSLDEIQWFPVTVGGPDYLYGTQTGLTIGRSHAVRWDRSSMVDGVKTYGPKTVNFKRGEKAGESKRMMVTPTGTASGTPVFRDDPKLHYKPYPKWWGPYYEELDTVTFDHTILQLFAGVGYITGLVTSGWEYQWQRKTVGTWQDITGATSAGYYWTSADMSADLTRKIRCRIRTLNGSVEAYTNELAIPEISESALLELNFDTAAPVGLVDDLQDYIDALKGAVSGDLYALTDVLKIPLHSAKSSLLNLKTPGGTAWDSVMSGYFDATGVYFGMLEEDFTPYLGFQGNGVDKWLAFNFQDTPTDPTVNWSLNAGSLAVHVNNSLDNSKNVSVLGSVGGNTQLVPNVTNNMQSRMHAMTKATGPASGGVHTGWTAVVREDAAGVYNIRGTTVSAKIASVATASTGLLNAYKGGTNVFAPMRADVMHIGRFNRDQYLEFQTITNAFLATLAAYA